MTSALLESRPTRTNSYEEGDFVVFYDVPVFKEHTNREGIRFGRLELEQICKRCNERIEDTGDYSVIILRHTPPKENEIGFVPVHLDDDPEVVGFAGPFRMGTVGNLKPKAAILAQLRIFKGDIERVKKYPRLSVEYWCSETNPYGGFFDPISLLGAETPELDLGIRYSKDTGGQRVIRYSKVIRFQASPGGSNTFIPGGVESDRDRKEVYARESSVMALTPEDVQQLITAFEPVFMAKLEERLAQLQPAGGDSTMTATVEAPLDAPADANPDESPDHYAKMCEYADGDDEEGGRKYLEGLDDDGKSSFTSKLDSEADEGRKTKLKKYMATDSSSGAPDMAVKYQKERDDIKVQYQKVKAERDEYVTKYQKLAGEHRDLQASHAKLAAEREAVEIEKRKAVRYQKLSEIQAQGYTFEVDEELAEVLDVTDEQFDRHCNRIVTKYQRVPGGILHVPESPMVTGERTETKVDRYHKLARERCEAAAKKNQHIPYLEAYKQIEAEEEGNKSKPAA